MRQRFFVALGILAVLCTVMSLSLAGQTAKPVKPPDGRQPPLMPEAQSRGRGGRGRGAGAAEGAPAGRGAAAAGPASYLDLGNQLRCISYHGVPPLPSGYNNTYQIFQSKHMIAILDEDIHHVRLVPMDGRPHLSSDVRHYNGDSRGHWEGNTLVVEDTNFSPKSRLSYGGTKTTTAVERFTRNGPYSIDYRYTRPFTVGLPLSLRDDEILEYACHEGNYAAENILRGARKQEADAAAAAARPKP